MAPLFPTLLRFEEPPLRPALARTARYRPADVACCYVARTATVRGRFHPERAIALGVPKGPLFGRLTHGATVTLADGTTVAPEQCKDPDVPGRAIIVAACPTTAFIPSLVRHPVLAEMQCGDAARDVAMVVHMAPAAVVQTRAYQRWMAGFAATAQHVVVNKRVSPNEVTFRSQALMQCRFSTISSRLFPLPYPLQPLPPARIARLSSGESLELHADGAGDADVDMAGVDGGAAAAVAAPTPPTGAAVGALARQLQASTSLTNGDTSPPAGAPEPPPRPRPRMSMMSHLRPGPSSAAGAGASASAGAAAGAGNGAGAGATRTRPSMLGGGSSGSNGSTSFLRPSMLTNTATGRIRVGQQFQAMIPELEGPTQPAAAAAPAAHSTAADGAPLGGTLVSLPAATPLAALASDSGPPATDSSLPLLPCGAVAAVRAGVHLTASCWRARVARCRAHGVA